MLFRTHYPFTRIQICSREKEYGDKQKVKQKSDASSHYHHSFLDLIKLTFSQLDSNTHPGATIPKSRRKDPAPISPLPMPQEPVEIPFVILHCSGAFAIGPLC